MAQVRWINHAGGSWQTASNWSTGAEPGSTDDVLINTNGNYVVTSTSTVVVNSVQLIANVTLDIVGSSFTMTSGTGSGVNAGTIIDDNASAFFIGGTVDNTGTIRQNSAGNTTDLRLNSAAVTLDGGGRLTLSDNSNNRIYGNAAADTLINVNNVISGAGQLGVAQMTLVNQSHGVINATGVASALTLNTGSNTVTNAGLIESTSAGGLVIQNTLIDDTGGGTLAAAGARAIVELSGATIRGGTLATSGGGIVETVGGNGALDGRVGGITNKGSLVVVDNTSLTLFGTINNTGTISESSSGNTTDIRLGYPIVTLQGGGTLAMSDNINNRIYGNGSGYQLINVDNTISGAGQLGTAQMTLTNEAKGVIDANQATQLVLNSPNYVSNAGLIEATGTGGLFIQNSTIVNGGGTIVSSGTGSHVDLGGSTIQGGSLTATNHGLIQTVGGNGALDGLTSGALTLSGTLLVTNGTVLTLDGTINNKGTINEAAGANTTDIRLGTPVVTLQGGGKLIMTDDGSNRIYGNAVVVQLNNVNDTISGAGQLGVANMQLSNGGTINATGTNALLLNFGSYDGTNNAGGLIEATGAGGLVLQSGIVTNNGTLIANGSALTYQSNVFNLNTNYGTLAGGTWEATANGTLAITGGAITTDAANIIVSGTASVFEAGDGNTFTNIGASLTAIAAGAQLSVLSNADLVAGATSIADSGTVTLGAGGTLNVKTLAIDAAGKLQGNGTEAGSVADTGTIVASGGTLAIAGGVSGSGVLQISGSAVASVGGGLTVKSVVFASGHIETLDLGKPAGATSTISGFATGDVIDLVKTAATSLSYKGNATSGVLTVKDGTGTVATLAFAGNYTTANFALAPDNNNGTKITEQGSAEAAFIGGTSPAPSSWLGALPDTLAAPDSPLADFGWSDHGAAGESIALNHPASEVLVRAGLSLDHETAFGGLNMLAMHPHAM